jgi:tetratricopeptide (TPR) repeat protein
MRLLYQRGGQQALTELVAAMGAGMTDEQAVAQAYGKPFREFEADWRVEVAKPRAKAASQKSVRPLVAKKLVFKEDAKGKTEPGDLASPREPDDVEAKRAIRLGEIFYARRRWAAAAHEYGRARARLPREIPLVSRRYAFSQARLGHYDAAEEALARAVEIDPQDEAVQALYGEVLTQQKKFDKAKIALDNGIATDPFDPELHAIYVAVAKELKDKPLQDREQKAFELASGRGTP